MLPTKLEVFKMLAPMNGYRLQVNISSSVYLTTSFICHSSSSLIANSEDLPIIWSGRLVSYL